MKKQIIYIIVLLFLISGLKSYSQEWLWSADINCTNTSQANGLKLDANGNLLMYMVFQDDISVGGRTIGSSGEKDILLSKFTPQGDTVWNKLIHSPGNDIPRDMNVLSTNEVLVTGGFDGVCSFDGISLTNTYSSEDIFLAKYASNGNVLWAKRIAWGPDQDRSSGITVDQGGNIALVGFFRDSIFFEHDTLVSNGNLDNFFAKYDANGNFIRAIHYPGTHAQTRLNAISLSNDNAYIISGFFNETLTIDGQDLITVGSNDLTIFKIDTVGTTVHWIRTGGGLGNDKALNAASDLYGNIYVTGSVSGTPSFDSVGLGFRDSSPLNTKGNTDMFLAKYNKNGTLQWKTSNGNTAGDEGQGVYVYGNIVQFTGYFSRTVIFGNDTLVSMNNSNDAGFFIYDTDGNPIKGASLSGALEDRGYEVAYDNSGNSYLGGYFFSDTLFMSDNMIIKDAAGVKNPFLAKYQIPFSVSFTEVEHINCNGDNNGYLTATPYFGRPPYSYAWSHDAGLNDPTAINLSGGMYSVTVTDSRDSTAFTSITLNEPSAISIASVTSDVSCNPANGTSNNGTIDITVTGGTVAGAYSYAWEAISGSGVIPTNEDQNSLTMGEYSVTVTDDNLCEENDVYLISQPDVINFSVDSIKNITIPPGSNGAVYLSPGGGTPVFDYSWTGPGGFNSTMEDITGLSIGGTYNLQITDGNSCIADSNFLVTSNTMLVAFISDKTDVSCFGDNDGSATVDATGSSGPFSYAWSNGGSTQTVSNLVSNTYYVTVTEIPAPFRSSITSVQINEPASALATSINPTHIDCFGDNTGIIDLSVSGGTLPYNFNWSNGGTTEDQLDLTAGIYSVTVTDKNGCQEIDGVTLTQSPAISISIDIDQGLLCFGDLTGILRANVSGGTGTFSYVWDDPGNQTAQTATNLGGGLYNVTATDQLGCSVTDSRLLNEPADINIVSNIQDVSCFGSDDGTIALTISGGSPGFSFMWSNGAISQNIQDLSAGPYRVTVTDVNNCSDTASAIVIEPDEVSFSNINISDASCNGYADGTISVVGAGGNGVFEYSFDGGSSYSSSGTYTNLISQNYTLRIRDALDCESTDSVVFVSQPEGTTIISETTTDATCFQSNDGTITVSASNPLGGLAFSLNGGTYLDNNGVFTGLAQGTYEVWAMDAGSCEQLLSSLTINSPDPIVMDTTVTHARGDVGGSIIAVASGGNEPYTYFLVSTDGDDSNATGEFSNLDPGLYELHATDDVSCSSDTVQVNILQSSTSLVIYDAFSPNGDGRNDFWNIGNIGLYPDCKLIIFNTWGTKVFSSDGYTDPWDGKYNGKDLPSGTYYYTLDPGDGSKVLSGPVSIVR